jgi:hypothetical protein
MIRGALNVGFSVKELQGVFAMRDKGGAPCHEVRKLGSQKLRDIEASIRELQSKQRHLKQTLAVWDSLLSKAHGRRAGLLEVFANHEERNK